MRIFLTGGTGFVGLPLAKKLLDRGEEVVALVRYPNSPQARQLAQMGAHCVQGDITDRESMRAGMTGVGLVIHNAAWYEMGVGADQHPLMHAINVTGTENVLGLAAELSVPRTVYVSSCVNYGGSGQETRDETYRREQQSYLYYYEQTKTEAHEIALDFQAKGLPLVIVCPNVIIGPNDHSQWGYYLRLYINGWMPPFAFSPDMQLSPVFVDDVAEGIALAGEKGRAGETYILAGDVVTMRQIMSIWNAEPGGRKVRFYIPSSLAKVFFAPMEPLLRMAGLPAFISREVVAGAGVHLAFSSARAQQVLGWRYRTSADVWQATIDGENELLAKRTKRDLLSRLKPVEL